MSEIIVTNVPFQGAVSAQETVTPREEVLTFENNFGGAVPNTVYCPSCSTLTEYNAKWGEVQEKRNPLESDYCFEVGYAQDETGLYARCLRCDFDLRETPSREELKPPKPKTQKRQVAIRQTLTASTELVWIANVRYASGLFIMPREEFMRVAKLGSDTHNLAARVGGSNYGLDWSVMLSEYKEINHGGEEMIGIARNHWRNL